MHIKNLPSQERPQEKLLFRGASCLSNAELMALVIRTGTNEKSAIQLGEDVISYVSSKVGDLGRADVRELTEIEGIGFSKASSIVASMELAKRLLGNSAFNKKIVIRDSADVANILMEEMLYEKRELVIALLLNVKGEIESKETISVGELSATNIHPREVFSPAIRKGAASIIVAHNHPSGDPTPSDEDIIATKRLIEASKIVGINLVDHVIIGHRKYVSLKAEGIIPY